MVVGSSSTNVRAVGKDLLRAFCNLFCLEFCFKRSMKKRGFTSCKLRVTSYYYCPCYELLFTYELRVITYCTTYELVFTYELRVSIYCASWDWFSTVSAIYLYDLLFTKQVFLASYSWAAYFVEKCFNIKLLSVILPCVKFLY